MLSGDGRGLTDDEVFMLLGRKLPHNPFAERCPNYHPKSSFQYINQTLALDLQLTIQECLKSLVS